MEKADIFVENHEGLMVSAFQKKFQKTYKHPLKISAELNSWELIARTVECGNGYGLMPDFMLLDGRHPDLMAVHAPSLPYSLSAITQKGHNLSYSAMSFANISRRLLRNTRSDVILIFQSLSQ